MKLELKNIGYLKKASVCLDGLTVIAGENDTGKSTVGKALMALIKADNMAKNSQKNFSVHRRNAFLRQQELLFEGQIQHFDTIHSSLSLFQDNKSIYECLIENKNFVEYDEEKSLSKDEDRPFLDCTFIQTPLVWDLYDFFTSIAVSKTQTDIEQQKFNPKYPYILWDTYAKLVNPREDNNNIDMIDEVKEIMGGTFVKRNLGKYYFSKSNQEGIEEKVNLLNVATGIKYFGLLQVLLEHCYINQKCFLIFDEPENHLHPKWQVKFAEVICQFVEVGIKILVNSHSPYMIEALERYSKKFDLWNHKVHFYVAKNQEIKQIEDDNNKTLSVLFASLSEPFQKFDEMDSERLNG